MIFFTTLTGNCYLSGKNGALILYFNKHMLKGETLNNYTVMLKIKQR